MKKAHKKHHNNVKQIYNYIKDKIPSTIQGCVEFTKRRAHRQTYTTGKSGSYTRVLESYRGQSHLAIQIAKDE